MDVQWIMAKRRQKVDRFEASIVDTRREEDPKYYKQIDREYAVHGRGLRKAANSFFMYLDHSLLDQIG